MRPTPHILTHAYTHIIQKDIYPQISANYSKFNEERTKVDYSENGIIKPMKDGTNLI